ncbi:hypothetical protein [Streptoalloteichus hindustanus]|uniref:hypothetical protein n=1 Tax=Streptoalloteichus hindustanus TaxID=2017 RepID=UPI00093586D1|nr:hypothetical protein [Streptoalloteichus hindustanus]
MPFVVPAPTPWVCVEADGPTALVVPCALEAPGGLDVTDRLDVTVELCGVGDTDDESVPAGGNEVPPDGLATAVPTTTTATRAAAPATTPVT